MGVFMCVFEGEGVTLVRGWLKNTFHMVLGNIFKLAKVETVVSHHFTDDFGKHCPDIQSQQWKQQSNM